MPYRRTSQWIVAGVSTLIMVFCLYAAIANARGGDTRGVWIFTAFAFLFMIPLFVTVFHFIADRSPSLKKIHDKYLSSGQKRKTTFAPHWFVISGVILIGLIMLYAIIKWLFIYFTR